MPDDARDNPPDPLPVLSYRTDANTARRSVRVAHFGNELQAHFVANLLERAGIPAFLYNLSANTFSAVPNLTPIELHVRPEDADQAAAILNDLATGRIPIPDPEVDPEHPGDPEEDADPRCPHCRSWQVRPYQSLKDDLLRLLHLRPPPSPGVVKLECLRCGHTWVDLAQENTRTTNRVGFDVKPTDQDTK